MCVCVCVFVCECVCVCMYCACVSDYLRHGATETDGEGEDASGGHEPRVHRLKEDVLAAVLQVHDHGAEPVQT